MFQREMEASLAVTQRMELRAQDTLAAETSNLEAIVARATQDRDAALARVVTAEAGKNAEVEAAALRSL